MDLLRGGPPLGLQLGLTRHPSELGRPVQRHPAHELGRDVVLGLAARLPDPLIGIAPHLGGAVGLGLHDRPQPPRQPLAAPRVQQDRVQHRAVDVVLTLVKGPVAHPHRKRARIAREVVAGRLAQVAAPIDPVHDLQRPVLVGLQIGHELHELLRLPIEVEEMQRLQRKRRVAHPTEPVIPVALPARRLGQRRRRRRHRRPRRHIGQALDRQRRTLNRLAPPMIGQPRLPQPPAPKPRRRGQPPVGLIGALGRVQSLGPRQRAEHLVALLQLVAGADPIALDAQRHVGLQAHRHPGTARIRGVTVIAHQRPVTRHPPVIEDRVADQLHLHRPVQTQHRADQQVVAVLIGRGARVRGDLVLAATRPHGQRVTDHDPPVRRLPRRQQGCSCPAHTPAPPAH